MKLKDYLSIYKPSFPSTVVYMLQATEYQSSAYYAWLHRTLNFDTVSYRKSLIKTKATKGLLALFWLGMLAQTIWGIYLGYHAYHRNHSPITIAIIVVFLLSAPVVWAQIIVVPLELARLLIIKPLAYLNIRKSAKIFARHNGVKIAIAGSYGKTTMKEILGSVLSSGLVVAATPGNKNVSSSHAEFAKTLTGKEDILLLEYGEGRPGDIARFSRVTKPDIGIITGLAPAHLDKYKSLKQAGEDIFSLSKYVTKNEVYVNADSPETKAFIEQGQIKFSESGVDGWQASRVSLSIQGTSFNLTKNNKTLKLKTKLIGRHLVGPIALAVHLATEAGIDEAKIIAEVAKLEAFEHRMQPKQLKGAWVIDDTYNGNIEGMFAGLQLLKELKAKNKIYVTPGLVDQGDETVKVHMELGKAIAKANPDLVVLMKNSVTDYIDQGIRMSSYQGKVRIEEDPLEFYTNLEHFVAEGDLVLMQNDWPDNYV